MATKKHLKILKQGVEVWNQWRKANPEVKPDLSGAVLSGAVLSGANLSQANLFSALLSDANLTFALLSDANLTSVILRGANLTFANLRNANLNYANLTSANLRNANLHFTNLRTADLSGADLSGADLTSANLHSADLSYANLSYANLSDADLTFAILIYANLTDTSIGWTVFGNVDLSEVKGLETTNHKGPSIIGIDTIYHSKGNIPYKFLLDAGIPKDDIAYLLSSAGKAIDFYSCFICYSNQDQAFAARLHADLQAEGVRCWYAPEDLKIGEPILSGIDQGIRLHDKLLLVLSEYSVASKGVEHQVESALAEEMRPDRKAKVLFPIRLNSAVMNTNVDWAYRICQTRHIGDFTQWKDHDTYQKAFDRLLRDLKTEVQK